MAIEVKERIIPVRVTPTQAEAFRALVEEEGMRVSAWLRDLGARACREMIPGKPAR